MTGLPRQRASRPGATPDGSADPDVSGRSNGSITAQRRWHQRMNHALEEWVRRHSQAKGSARAVMFALVTYAHWDSADCWPAVPTIARDARCSVRTAQRALRRLEALGELAIERRYVRGGQTSSIYTFPQFRARVRSYPHLVSNWHPPGDKMTPEVRPSVVAATSTPTGYSE